MLLSAAVPLSCRWQPSPLAKLLAEGFLPDLRWLLLWVRLPSWLGPGPAHLRAAGIQTAKQSTHWKENLANLFSTRWLQFDADIAGLLAFSILAAYLVFNGVIWSELVTFS